MVKASLAVEADADPCPRGWTPIFAWTPDLAASFWRSAGWETVLVSLAMGITGLPETVQMANHSAPVYEYSKTGGLGSQPPNTSGDVLEITIQTRD